MIKHLSAETCAFDCEWVPCVDTARQLLHLDPAIPEREAFYALWREYAGDDPIDEDGKPLHPPFLKLALCKVVSISAVFRRQNASGTRLEFYSRAIHLCPGGEAELIGDFLERVAYGTPAKGFQLWGYNSSGSDLPILKQRAIALGVCCPKFSRRPDKPWEGMDYHDNRSEAHVDIMYLLGSYGRSVAVYPKMSEFAAACGIPGKLDCEGDAVAELYLQGRIREIADYNLMDAIVTHLLMLRIAHHAGQLNSRQYQDELAHMDHELSAQAGAGSAVCARFQTAWHAMRRDGDRGLVESDVAAPPGAAGEPLLDPDQEPAGKPDGADTSRLQGQWVAVLGQARTCFGVRFEAALRSKKRVQVVGDQVRISFANETVRNIVSAADTYPEFEALLSDILGRPIYCVCQTGDQDLVGEPG